MITGGKRWCQAQGFMAGMVSENSSGTAQVQCW
jgi:hypothetical protein